MLQSKLLGFFVFKGAAEGREHLERRRVGGIADGGNVNGRDWVGWGLGCHTVTLLSVALGKGREKHGNTKGGEGPIGVDFVKCLGLPPWPTLSGPTLLGRAQISRGSNPHPVL